MRRSLAVVGVVAMAVLCARTVAAQAPAGGEPDPGVRPTRLIDRAEVRVTRVELQPGATRRSHTHDDVVYHLWVPVEGKLQLNVASDPPVAAASGQAFFFKKGTPHGFKNVGTTPAAVLEIFVKQAGPSAQAALDQIAPQLAVLLGATSAE
jgi:quercetin dioxygenase-like cupin family protein